MKGNYKHKKRMSPYLRRIQHELTVAKWMLSVTEHKNKPVPVLIVKRFIHRKPGTISDPPARSIMKVPGMLYGPQLNRCKPVLRIMLNRIHNRQDIPLDMGQYFSGRILFRGNLPLNDETGYKLALIFKLQERIRELDRVELIARRVACFTREEAAYWYSRISNFGKIPNRWAVAGMKLLLAGHPKDPHIGTMLNTLRGIN